MWCTCAGRATVGFDGRVAKRALRPGSYVLKLTPRSMLGETGQPVSVAFRVIK